jgi:hypothetical protein
MTEITKEMIEQAAKKLESATKELKRLEQARAEQECPFSVGDTVDCCGHSYKGEKMLITGIYKSAYLCWSDDWSVTGRVINKDGKPGSRQTQFSDRDYKKFMEAK